MHRTKVDMFLGSEGWRMDSCNKRNGGTVALPWSMVA